jgi:phosphoribosyl-AMP cyclohydrolase
MGKMEVKGEKQAKKQKKGAGYFFSKEEDYLWFQGFSAGKDIFHHVRP